MNRLKYIYPQPILHILYNTLILPHLNYCVIVWGFDYFDEFMPNKSAGSTVY